MRSVFPLVLCLLGVAAAAVMAESHPFNVRDLVMMNRLSDPQASPDGKWVVYVLRETDLEANKGKNDLWLVSLGGGAPRRLTTNAAGDTNPRWAPDGSAIYFLSTRSGSSQVWRLDLAGGEPQQVTALPLDVANLVISPDGRHLVFTLTVFPDCDALECTTKRLADREASQQSGQVYDRLFARHWDTWSDGRRSHLFVLPSAGGEPRDLTRGLDADVPSAPHGGTEEFAFTPDGREIVFSARIAGKTEAWSTNFDLYAVPLDASAPPRNLTASNPAQDTQPAFSHDGKTLVYLAMSRPGFEADRLRIMVRSWPEGTPREVAPKWDRSPSAIALSPDGKTVYAAANDLGHTTLTALDVATGAAKRLVEKGHVSAFALAGDKIVLALEHHQSPVDLHTIALDGSGQKSLTAVNRERLAGVRFGDSEQFTFAGAGGETVYAWVVKPVDFDPAKKYPLAFLIHGGPQGSFGNDFHYRWNPQTYAGAGFAAVMVDFHGSTGYGQAFTDSISKDWGGKPLEDLKKGLAEALRRYPWIDGSRACALGGSYGGFMTNWIAGNWFNEKGEPPFRCLVSHASIFDQRAMSYSTEELWFTEWEFGGTQFENPALFEKWNPMAHVSKWKTPMLVIHGALDYRIPEAQGIGAFTALQRRGIPSKLLFFPDENHWVLKPKNSIQWHDTVLDWLKEWTK